MRKSIVIVMLLSGVVWALPAAAVEQICSIEPCCAMDQPMECCTIEEPPAPAPDLVLSETVRVEAPVVALGALEPRSVVSHEDHHTIAPVPFAGSPPDRLALLSTYLI